LTAIISQAFPQPTVYFCKTMQLKYSNILLKLSIEIFDNWLSVVFLSNSNCFL
jgi:hypothetical protein